MNRLTFLPLIGLLLCGTGCVLVNMVVRPVTKLVGLMLLYLGGSVLLLNVCSFQVCAALFVCGIGVTVLLGSAQREKPVDLRAEGSTRAWLLFRLLLCLVIGVLAYIASDLIRFWVPVRSTILFISLWIGLMSLFSLSLEDEMLYRCILLQSLCFTFTVCYMFMESSVLVFAFFAVINLLMAFGGSVLSMGGLPEKSEDQPE
jgi:hypothetical protein